MTDERDAEREKRVKVVYCGGCNPYIDRSAVAAGLPLDDLEVGPGATVHLSGCPRACASDHQLAGPDGTDDIVVAGELVDGVPTPEAQLAPTITRKLKE
jgi:hypothetical protein